jgi:hypothetical protein
MLEPKTDLEPETFECTLAAMGGYVERLLKAARLVREWNFPALEAEIRGELARTRDQLFLVACGLDGEPRQRVALMQSAIIKALNPPRAGPGCVSR